MSAPRLNFPYGSGGGGGGGVSGTGTPPALAMWATSSSLTDSPLSFASQTLTLSPSVRFFTFGHHQQWTIPANAYGFAINNQLVLDTGSGYLGINPPTTPASPLHVEGTVGSSSEMVRLRNQLAGINSHVTIQTHANALGGSSPTGKIQNYTTALTPGYGVYDWVYSLPNPNGVMTEVFRQTAPTTILTVTLTSGGSGYTNGSYSQAALTNVSSSGSGATADIVVAGGIVTVAVLRSGGSTYQVGDTLTCASIGGGTGFVLTVASVGSLSAATAAVTAPRIGAGTAAPVAAMDAVGGSIVRSPFLYNYNYNSGTNFQIRAHLGIDSSAEPSGATVLAPTDAGPTGIVCRPIYDATAITGNVTPNGISVLPQISAPPGGTVGLTGLAVSPQVNAIGMTGKTVSIVGVSSGGQINNQGAGNTASLTAFSGAAGVFSNTATIAITALTQVAAGGSVSGVAHTVTDFHWYRGTGSTFNNGVVVTNFYGLRLGTPTLAGGATITNRFGISQEDTLATNQFSATTNTFSGVVRATGTTATAPAFSTPTDTNTGMYFPAADTLRFATAGSPAVSITSGQVLQFDSGFGSVANAYGCRAWVNFNGTGVIAIRASGNVSSITDAAVGQYVVNFTSAMPDVNYAAIGTKQNAATNADVSFYDCFNAVSSVPARTVNASGWLCLEGSAFVDPTNVNVAYFR